MASSGPISLTPAERPAYAHLFALADPQNTGMVQGSSAVSFFALSSLPSPVLGTIWALADSDNNGFLGPAQFSAALRLIGHAQSGAVVTEELLSKPGPLPKFKGIAIPGQQQAPSRSGSTITPQTTGTGVGANAVAGANEIKPEDRARYTRIFASAGPQNGLLDGEKAKDIFVKSQLPFDKLGAIWNLADTKARGKLDLTDFIVGMHFIQSTMNGSLSSIPAALPAGLYEKAAGAAPASISPTPTGLPPSSPLRTQNTGGSSTFLPRQMTGGGFAGMPGSPLRSPPPPASAAAAATPLQAQRTGAGTGAWAVSPADKAKADRFFDGLDQEHKGVLEGQAAVPFFMQSGLGEATLAHIWDLSDVTQSGSLTRDEFAVAMHLINLKLTGSDLPQELPASLVPPGLRGTSLPQAVNPAETDTQRDLFSLIDDDDANNLPVSTASAFATPASKAVASTPAPAAPAAASAFKSGPFDDDFLATSSSEPQAASSAVGTAGAGAMPTRSLDAGAELGNSRLALDSTQRSLTTLETKRSELQKSVDDNDQNIGDIKARLESVKLRHQTETEAVKSLTERQAAQAAELSELRQTSVRDESELSRLRGEKDELEQALMRDREEVREMKKQASETQRQRDALAAEVEKLRKDARMQRGLVAIGKKQLSQAESDMEKTRQQLEEVKSGKFEHEPEAAAAAAAASDTTTTAPATAKEEAAGGAGPVSREASISSPAHVHQAVASPAASVRSTNPFDRLGGGAGVAAGAGAGAAALGAATVAGAAAIHHHAAATDEKEDEDPFGVSKQSSSQQTPAPPAAAAFDDNFGNDFQPQESNAFAAVPAPAQSNVNQAFDDAFADLDKDDEVAAKDEAGPVEVGQTDATPQADESHPTTATTAFVDEPSSTTEPAHVAAPTADEVTSDADVINVDKGKAAVRDADEDSYEDSSDEEEGPEDVDGGAHTTASKAPTSDVAGNEGTAAAATAAAAAVGGVAAGGLAASALPSATTTTQAADRFPEINDDDLEPATDATETLAPPSSHLDTSSAPGPVPLSAQATGDTDAAFHDAPTGETPSTADFGTVGMGHAAQASSASALSPAHERFTTAVDDSTASPATKTRRAPPPAPSRGSTLSTTSAALSPLATSVAPGPVPAPALATSTAPVAAPASTLDDFDAAFEDLGPATSTVGGTAPIAASGASANGGSTSFDDAFGNGDADDFDFVPKFQQPPSSAFGSHQAQGSSANDAFDQAFGTSSAPQSGGFDGFDGAFAPPTASSQPPQPPPRQQPQQHPSATASQGSAFSFEDAFAPASTPPSLSMPGGASAAPAASNATSAAAKAATPALADDAGPVKQLCGMGFSRESVIKALEKSNYRTEKALERLLAQTA